MELKFRLNDIVTVSDPAWKNLYNKKLEKVGAGEDTSRRWGYIVQINKNPISKLFTGSDDLLYFVLEEALTATGEKGSRKKVHEGGLQIPFPNGEYEIVIIKDLEDLDADKPYSYKYKEALVLKFRKNYQIGNVMDLIRDLEKQLELGMVPERIIILDFSEWENLGYLGMGTEIFELIDTLSEYDKVISSYGLNENVRATLNILLTGTDQNNHIDYFNSYNNLDECLTNETIGIQLPNRGNGASFML